MNNSIKIQELRVPTCHDSFELAEGPRWDDVGDRLIWLDVPAQRLHTLSLAGHVSTTRLERWISAVGFCRGQDRYIAVLEKGFGWLDPSSGSVVPLVDVETTGVARMNDGAVDPAGRFLAGSVSLDTQRADGSLFSFDAHGRVRRLLTGVRLSNGIGWSPGGDSMYHADSLRGTLDAFDYDPDDGSLSGRRTIRTFERPAVPDGLCVDAAGAIWIALWGGQAVHRYSPAGKLLEIVRLPVANVTACALGGRDLSTLFITTARQGDEAALHAGALFSCRVSVPGIASHRFEAGHCA